MLLTSRPLDYANAEYANVGNFVSSAMPHGSGRCNYMQVFRNWIKGFGLDALRPIAALLGLNAYVRTGSQPASGRLGEIRCASGKTAMDTRTCWLAAAGNCSAPVTRSFHYPRC